ncbi:hypothetical protein [Tenacibaculum geojense]|uniref:Uncharacterized protein n=1 Tax=Tenacibaculum geojense TaxID=915352 RepID=A0ABW3JME3_9FLAO
MHPLIIIGLLVILGGSFLIHLGTKKAADKRADKITTEISLSKEEIMNQIQNLDSTSQKKIFDFLSPEFESVKQEVQISNDQLFERISKLDQASKMEILKLVRPKLEYTSNQTHSITENDGTIKTTFRFDVPTNQDVPLTDFLIQFDQIISKAEMWRKDQNQNTMIETRFNINPNTNGLVHKIYNITMHQYIVLEVWSKTKPSIVRLEIN